MTYQHYNEYLNSDDYGTLVNWFDKGIKDSRLSYIVRNSYHQLTADMKDAERRLQRLEDHIELIKPQADSIVLANIQKAIKSAADDARSKHEQMEQYQFYSCDLLEFPPRQVLQEEMDRLSPEEQRSIVDSWSEAEQIGIDHYFTGIYPSTLAN